MQPADIKVLFLTFWYPSKKHPGFGIFIKEHAKAVLSQGIPIELCAYQFEFSWHPFKVKTYTFEDEHGVPTHQMVVHSLFYRFIQINPWHNYWLLKPFLKKIYKRFPFQIIHANVVSPCGVAAMLLARHFEVPYLITEHWTRLRQYLKNNKFSFMGIKAYHRAAAVTAVSNDLRNTIIENFYLAPEKITVVPNVVDPALFYYKPKPLVADHYNLVFIGNLRLPKRPDLILKALHICHQKLSRGFVLHIFGTGTWQAELAKQAAGLNVVWHGVCSKSQIAQALQNADLLIHATENETFSLVVAEALCCGTPVVVSDLAVLRELVTDGENGFLVENTDEAFCSQIKKALTTEWHHEAIAAKAAVRFTPKHVGEQFFKIYRDILKKP